MFTPDGKKLVFVGESPLRNRLVVWDIEHARLERTTEDRLLPSGLTSASLSREGNIIALAGWEYDRDEERQATIVLWDLAAERPLYRLDQWADHLAFSPDDRTLIGVGRDGKAQVWDPRNGTLRETIQVCEAGQFAIRDLAVAPESRHFATAMGNGTARIFRLSPPPERVEPREPLPVVAPRAEPPIDESGAMAPGATYAAFSVQSGRRGQALQPVNLLIGPNGRVVMGIDSPWSLEKELEAVIGAKAKVPAARE
jgi:hypothetical protein